MFLCQPVSFVFCCWFGSFSLPAFASVILMFICVLFFAQDYLKITEALHWAE